MAGPAVLPKSVLEKAQSELVNYENSGMSVMELSHRSSLFETIIENAETLLRELMNIPDNYKVLFLQGGASSWSKKAISEAKKIDTVEVQVIASSEDKNFTYIPEVHLEDIPQDAAYLHITTNNTIEGTTIYDLPKTGKVPLIADMSSNILSINYNVADFGLIYAGAQKNIGPAGLTVVIVREDLIGQVDVLSAMLDYDIHAKNGSMYNTPPTYSIYIAKLVFEWIKEQGGVSQMEKLNKEKSAILYNEIDASALFSSPVNPKDRSINNIPFITGNDALDKKFNQEAIAAGFENLKGHRSVGGMRASLYNAFPKVGVEALIHLMKKFESENGGTK
ncbi:hypothetical protein HW555_014151 [Spodoptera exigua]|uniref:phosphoserine transaminase n=1 Tax=Spodoptera exigua TaxID=7107 RepID=A0A835KXY3_SPOEX|nr:hypothetical protein HW555_014151 [Spodoptera exigua]